MGGFNCRKRGLRARWQLLLLQWLVPVLALAASSAAIAEATLSKIFIPNVIGPGSVSTAIFTITNTGGTPVTGLEFTDTLPIVPGDVDIATPANAFTSCLDGIVTAPDGGGTISFSNGKIGVGETCVVSVNVTASTPGAHTNPAITLIYNELDGDPPTSSPVDLTVSAALPGFSKSFEPGSVPLGDRSTLTFTIDNSANGSNVLNLDFTDSLPQGMVIADPANAATTCGTTTIPPSLTADAGTSVIILDANGTSGFPAVAAEASCTVSMDVINTSIGTLDNISGDLLANFVTSGKASATLEVTAADIALRKAFTDDPVPPGSSVTLEFTIDNLTRDDTATNIAFSDDGAAALPGLTFTSLLSNDCGGTVTGVGTTHIDFGGGTLAGASYCTIRVGLTVPADATPGVYTNVTSNSTIEGDGISASLYGDLVVGNQASDDLYVEPTPLLTKEFLDAGTLAPDPVVNPGDDVVIRFTVTNTSTTSAATDITFGDELTDGGPFTGFLPFPVSATLPTNPTCGGSLALVSFGTDRQGLELTGGSLDAAPGAGSSCSFDVTVNIPADMSPAIYRNTTEEIIATVDGASRIGPPASDTLTVVAAPRLTKAFLDPVAPGGTVSLEFTLSYPADASGGATEITFTDDLAAMGPALAGLTANLPPLPDPPCGAGSSLAGSAGDTLLTLMNGSLSPGGTCTFSVTLDVPEGAAPGSYTNTTSAVSATVEGVTATSRAASDVLNVAGLNFTKEFLGDPVIAGDTVTLRFTIDNIHPTADATITFFSDNLQANLTGLAATGGPTVDTCGGTLSGTTFLIYTGGSVLSGATCTIEVEVLVPAGSADGSYNNVTSSLSATQGGAVVIDPATDRLLVDSNRLQLTKSFTDDPVAPGDPVTLEFTLTNLDAGVAASAIDFTDNLGATLTGLTFDSVLFDDCGGTVSGTGTNTITVTGASLSAGGSCTLRVSLTVPAGAGAGIYTNTTSDVTGDISGFPVTGDPASNDLNVIQKLLFSKSFDGPTTATGTATLTFTITNPGENAATELQFSDDLDAAISGLIAVSLPALPCGAGSFVNGISFLTFTGGEVPPSGGSCSFDVEVLAPVNAAAGTYPNTTSVLFQSGLPVAEPATADFTIEPAPAFNKLFAPDTIFAGGTSTLTFTIDNTTSVLAASSLAFVDSLPAGLLVASPVVASNSCGGTLSATAGNDTISLVGGTVAAATSCTIAVDVTGTVAGSHLNTTGDLTSSSGNSGAASDALTVNAAADLSVSKTNGVTWVTPGQSMTYTIVAANAGPSAEPSAIVTDAFPVDLSCSWTSVAAGGATGNTASGSGDIAETLSMPAGSSVTYTADCSVASDASGTLSNTAIISGSVHDPVDGNNSDTDLDVINQLLGFTKAFSPDLIAVGDVSTLTFTINNSGSSADATALAFTDNLPAGVLVATPAVSSNSCGGTLAAAAGSGVISLAGGTVTATASCSIAVDVTGTAAGSHLNTTGDLTSSLGNSGMASDTLTVNPQPGFTKEFGPDTISIGQVSTLSFVINNSGSSVDATALAFTDNLPAGVLVATPAGASNSCGGTLTATAGSGVISLAGGTVAASASCTIALDVTGTVAGSYLNTTGDLTSSLGNSGTASDTLTVNTQPGFTKEFGPDTIGTGQVSTLSFVINNSGSSVDATALAFTDNLPAGVLVATPAGAANSCGGTLTATAGSGVISLAGGTVAATASCSIAVDVTGTVAGSHLNTTGDLTSSLGNSGTASDTLTINPQPGFAKEFGPDTIGTGQVSTLSFVINNSGSSVDATALAFTDNLPHGVLVTTPPVTANTCGGTLTAGAGTNVITLTSGLVGAGASCSISVDVTATDLGTHLNTTSELVSSLGSSSPASDTLNVIPTLTVVGLSGGSGTVTGPGIDCSVTDGVSSGDCSESVAVGTLVTLTAVADPGSESPVWGGCDIVHGASGELCDITLNIDSTVTVAFSADDGDGIPGATEDLVENPDGAGNGDGNGDGTADRMQRHVTSLYTNNAAHLVTVANETGKYQQDSFKVSPPPADAPVGVNFPIGLLEFRVTGVQVGGVVEMSVYVPDDIPVNAYYKPNAQGIWVNVAKNISQVGNKTRISFDLTDGDQFDGDHLANADIQDPGAPAFELQQQQARAIPTMNVWGLLILSTLLGLILLRQGRGRQA